MTKTSLGVPSLLPNMMVTYGDISRNQGHSHMSTLLDKMAHDDASSGTMITYCWRLGDYCKVDACLRRKLTMPDNAGNS